MILEEGFEFNFTVEKIIDLPDESYYILLSEFDKKYLLPTKYYDEYNLKIGKEIRCRIDRINCNGRVFLEPKSPIYSIGDKDIFTLLEVKQKEKHRTKDKYLVIKAISSKTNRAIVVDFSSCLNYSLGENYLCEILKIKKAEMYLRLISKV
jgi:hypothetical protein